jgi:hypothetical protein
MNNEIDTQSRDSVGQWAVHDVRMARDPSNVRHATKNVSFFAIENYFNYALTTHKEDSQLGNEQSLSGFPVLSDA